MQASRPSTAVCWNCEDHIFPNEMRKEIQNIEQLGDDQLKEADGLSSEERNSYEHYIKNLVGEIVQSLKRLASNSSIEQFHRYIQDAKQELIDGTQRFLMSSASYSQQKQEVKSSLSATAEKIMAADLCFPQINPNKEWREEEIRAMRSTYTVGYLQETMQKNPNVLEPVFEYMKESPYSEPGTTEPLPGFLFAGSIIGDLHSSQASDDIIDGNFVRCPNLAHVRIDENIRKAASITEPYITTDLLITGTRDKNQCDRFKNALLTDAAAVAASEGLDPKDPISDTPVVDCSKKGFREVGDLTTLTEERKKQIKKGNFTACNTYAIQKTRLSERTYDTREAIVVGTNNEKICQQVHVDAMRKLIARIQAQKLNQ